MLSDIHNSSNFSLTWPWYSCHHPMDNYNGINNGNNTGSLWDMANSCRPYIPSSYLIEVNRVRMRAYHMISPRGKEDKCDCKIDIMIRVFYQWVCMQTQRFWSTKRASDTFRAPYRNHLRHCRSGLIVTACQLYRKVLMRIEHNVVPTTLS